MPNGKSGAFSSAFGFVFAADPQKKQGAAQLPQNAPSGNCIEKPAPAASVDAAGAG
jgi:hypothetical protein